MPDRVFGIEIDRDRPQPELGEERRHDLGAGDILGDREHGEILAKPGLQPFQGRPFAPARRAPGGPEIEQNRLSGKRGQGDSGVGRGGQDDRGRRMRRRCRNEFAERRLFRCGRFGLRRTGDAGEQQAAGRSPQGDGRSNRHPGGQPPLHAPASARRPAAAAMTATKEPGDEPTNRQWGGRFAGGPAAIMRRINASIDFDKRLWAEDIRGSLAHCAMLVAQNILSPQDGAAIAAGLEQIRGEIERGEFAFSEAHEDIHMNIEARLAELIGPVAGRLHTARSRNDQVATDLRLWLRAAIDRLDAAMRELQSALVDRAEGAAALAGTSFPIDRDTTAAALGFERPMANSLDAVSDRDFAVEFLAAAALAGAHLSRLAEEIVIWCSDAFAFIALSDAFTTGSSIMPQKRNPDAAELIRAKTGRLNGALLALLTVIKGLPLAYSKDLQEDKIPVFEAADALELCLAAMTGMVRDLRPDRDRLRAAAGRGFATATDLADWLVRAAGLPFRRAHRVTGAIVKRAETLGVSLAELPLAELQAIEPAVTAAVYEVLDPARSVDSRTSYGGTAPARVRAAAAAARQSLARERQGAV